MSSSIGLAQLERRDEKPLGWRDSHAVQGRADLWRLMQHVEMDNEVRDLLELRTRVSVDSSEPTSLTPVIEFKRLCLQCGIDPAEIIKLMKSMKAEVPSQKALEKGGDPVDTLLGLPVTSAAKAAWIGAFFAKFASGKDSAEAQRAEAVMDSTQMVERAMIILTLLHDGYHIVRGSKEIKKMKAALDPVSDDQRAELESKKDKIEAQIQAALDKKDHAMDLDFFAKFHELMMIKAQLHPEKYASFRKLLEAQINDIEKTTQDSRERLKENVKLAALDITDVVLEILDPSGLLKSGVGLVIKTQGLYEKVTSATKTISQVKESLRCQKIAESELNALIEEVSGKEVDETEGDAHVKMLRSAAKLNRCFWEAQQKKHVENVSLKTLSLAGGILGLAGLVCKILAIVGVIAGTTALMASSFGLAGVIILAAVIILKTSVYLYKHRNEIACHLQVFKLQMASFFTSLVNKAAHGKLDERIKQYSQKIHVAKCELELARLSNKVGQIGITRIRKLAVRHFEVVQRMTAKAESEGEKTSKASELSNRVFKAITGKFPRYSLDPSLSPRDLQDRFVASVIQEMMT
jgi:hypothetical protein